MGARDVPPEGLSFAHPSEGTGERGREWRARPKGQVFPSPRPFARVDRPLAFAIGALASGALSFLTLLIPRAGALGHLRDNATWALTIGAVVLALLAADGARERRALRVLIGVGVAAAGLRAIVLFAVGR